MKINKSKHIIYGLFDPNTQELRYIGYTSNFDKRYYDHHYMKKLKINNHKNNWIKSLLNNNQKAEMFVIEYYETAQELLQAEIETIAYYKYIGCNLTNATPGGDGIKNGYKHPKSFGEKLSNVKKGVKRPPHSKEHCEKISIAKKGKRFTNDGQFKKKLSNEQTENIKIDYATGDFSTVDLGKKYNVSNVTIGKIVKTISLTNDAKQKMTDRWQLRQSGAQKNKKRIIHVLS